MEESLEIVNPAQVYPDLTGGDLIFTSPGLNPRLGQKCDVEESQLLSLLIKHGLIRVLIEHGFLHRVPSISVETLNGDCFKIRLAVPTVGGAKAEIARVQGTSAECQDLYRLLVREDGGAVREEDDESELLDDDQSLGEGTVIMVVKNAPLRWRTFPEDAEVYEDGMVVTRASSLLTNDYLHITSGNELTVGRHFWEVTLDDYKSVNCQSFIGVTRPNLEPKTKTPTVLSTDAWLIDNKGGFLWGNVKDEDDRAGPYSLGDRVGVLLDLDNGSLLFFKNGVQHGPGFPAGSLTGPVVAAVLLSHMFLRLHADVPFPAGREQ